MTIKVQKTHELATFEKAHASDTGWDLTCCDVIEKKSGLFFLDLGIRTQPPAGHYFQLYPRSSFSKTKYIVANSVGIIDTDYRGQWYLAVKPINVHYPGNFTIEDIKDDLLGKKVAQAVLFRMNMYQEVQFTDKLSNTKRGEGSFGSSDEKSEKIA